MTPGMHPPSPTMQQAAMNTRLKRAYLILSMDSGMAQRELLRGGKLASNLGGVREAKAPTAQEKHCPSISIRAYGG